MTTSGRAILPLITLLACKQTMSTDVENRYHPQRYTAGMVSYETTWMSDPGAVGDELGARVLGHNTASPRVVYFDGKSSRTEEVNADYGFRSPCIKLWLAGADSMLYCKELPHLRFCIAMSRPPAPIGGPPPSVTEGDAVHVVAGISGRTARVAAAHLQLDVVHAPDVLVEDPTGAIDRIDGVSGFVLEHRSVASAPGAHHVRRVTVTRVAFAAPAPELFARPAGFRWFDSLDAARAEDRRLGEQQAAAAPALSAEDRKHYLGRWELDGASGAQILEIDQTGAGYQLTTIEGGASRTETASLLGHQLQVDDPPNYRLYRLEPDHQHLVLVGDPAAFRYHRAASPAH